MISAGAAGQARPGYQSGSHVELAFEGWRPNEDGTFSFMFGYGKTRAHRPILPGGRYGSRLWFPETGFTK